MSDIGHNSAVDRLTMCKKMEAKVADVAYLDETRDRALFLIHRETKGSADTENAMHRVARRCGVSYWMLWTLRHRPPKLLDKFVRAYFAIESAYQAERTRQEQKFNHERIRAEATGSNHLAIRAAVALVGQDNVKKDDLNLP